MSARNIALRKAGVFLEQNKDGKLEFLTVKNSLLVLVDYQPSMIRSVSSGDKTIMRAAAFGKASGQSKFPKGTHRKSVREFKPYFSAFTPYMVRKMACHISL